MEEEKEISNTVKVENAIQIPEIKLEWDNLLNKILPNDGSGGDDGDGGDGGGPDWCVDNYIQKGPFISTEWSQWSGYNNLINSGNCAPNYYNSGKAPTGCIATAMAQIMKYLNKPNSYNWNNMPNNIGTYDTQLLMRDIGNGWISYSCGSSSQESCNIPGRFNQLGYSASFTNNYNTDLITQQLNWNKPVIISGGRKKNGISWNMYTDGHAWVCDGYRRNDIRYRDENGNCLGWGYLYFHMNWGWNGDYNAWFNAHNFNPSTYTYNFKRKIVYNIAP